MPSDSTVDAMGQTATLINTQGPVTVVLALFIIIFLLASYYIISQNKNYQKSNDENMQKLIDIIIDQNNRINETKIQEKTKERLYEEKNLMNIFFRMSNRFKEDCKETLDAMNADRVSIYAFHNGSQSTHGLPFVKFSCVCEYIVKGSGSRSKMKAHNNVPLNLLDDVMNSLWKNGHYEVNAEDLEEENNLINKLLMQDSSKTCIFYAIYDIENTIIGFILGEFSEKSFAPEEIKEKKKYLRYLADKISPIMEFSHYQKDKEKVGD